MAAFKMRGFVPKTDVELGVCDCPAFGKGGIIYVGTQCGGLAMGTPQGIGSRGKANSARPTLITASDGNALGWSHYQWTVIKGPWHMPLTATGKGLPGNLVNSVATTWANHLVVATDEGIALGRLNDGGRNPSLLNLTFEHGRNFVAKVYGLWHPPVHWQAPSGQLLEQLPTEDHTTVAAWQPNPAQGARAGYLWLGHWRAGLDVWQYNADGKIIQRWHIHEPQVGNYVESLRPLKGNAMAVGCYGKGVFIITLPGESKNAWRKAAPGTVAGSNGNNAIIPSEPRAARPPSACELTAMANAIRTQLINSSGQKQPRIVPLPDDWRTEGSWLGRYGKYWIDLAAVCSPYDFVWGTDESSVFYVVGLAIPLAGDEPRYWVQQLQTANRRALELPAPYMQSRVKLYHARLDQDRRDASIDDHGEVCPASAQGPGLYTSLNVPAGPYVLSIYDCNDNGHAPGNADRDYRVDVRVHPPMASPENDRSFQREPRLAMGRVANFVGGVWNRFLVRGPADITVQISRNHSMNTMFNAMALDPLKHYCIPYFGQSVPGGSGVAFAPHLARPWKAAARESGLAAEVEACDGVFRDLAAAGRVAPASVAGRVSDYVLLARVYQRCTASYAASASAVRGADAALAICYWNMCMFRKSEHDEVRLGLTPARKIEKSLRWDGSPLSQVDEDGTKVRRWRSEHKQDHAAPKFSF